MKLPPKLGAIFLQRIQTFDDAVIKFATTRMTWRGWKAIALFLSHPPYWRPILGIAFLTVMFLSTPRLRIQLLWLVLAILLSDQTCNLIKAIVKRVRPDGLRKTTGSIWRKIGYYSFPSSHAANTFNFAVISLKWLGTWWLALLGIAILIALARVYRKNHYASDVVAGAVIGLLYGWLFLVILG